MKKLIPLLICFCSSVFFFSCQKEISFTDPSQTNNGGTGSGGNGGGSGSANGNTFCPLTKDTWWKYKDSLSGMLTDGKVTDRTKTIGGILYTGIVPITAPATDTSWMAAPRPNYYITQKGVSPAGNPYNVLFHYLNDTASVGYSWRYNAGHGNGFIAYVRTTIVEKNITMTVAGKNYTNVTHTRLDLSYDLLGTIEDFGSYDYYIAKGIGIIKIRTELSMFGIPIMQTSADLLDYSIK
jgi:hypothetical protein